MWWSVIGQFKKQRAILLLSKHMDCFQILYLLFILLTNAFSWPSGRRAGMQPLGPGFDSQVHPIFVHIFHNLIICRFPTASYHALPATSCHVSHNTNPMVKKWMTTMLLVKASVDNSRKSTRLDVNGPQISRTNLLKGPTPPWFFHNFPFIFFY